MVNVAAGLSPLMRRHLGEPTLALLHQVGQIASRMGVPFYLVGGSVRDLLLDHSPRDLDLVVEGDAAMLASEVARRLSGQALTMSQFGTASVVVEGNRLDLATARKETYARPGALPRVVASTLLEDLGRRDFTINTMAVALSWSSFGTLVDMHGGQADLRGRLVRILHPRSFVDDATRILRAIRYEQRLGFRLEDETALRLGEAVAGGMFDTISGDRLRRELDLLLQEEEPLKPLLRAAGLGVLRGLYAPLDGVPGLHRLVGAEQPDDPLVYLAVIASHLTTKENEAFIKRLNLTSRWAQVVRDTISLRPLLGEVASTTSVVQLCHMLDCLSHSAVKAHTLMEGKSAASEKLRRYLAEYRYVKPSLSGRELLALGVPQGPTVGAVLARLREARLEGRIANRSEEVALVGALLKDPSLTGTS